MFSATFRYALISLLEIASAADGVNTATIADRHRLPATYLANVLRDLRRLGLIVSQKGHRGGHQLAVTPEQIDLLSLQEGLAGAAAPDDPGPDHPALGAEVWLQSIERRWRQELASTNLLDVQRLVDAAVDQSLAQPEAHVR